MSLPYIISQILTIIEYGLLGLSYLSKNRKTVVILDIFSMATGIIAYLLLGADLGMGMSIIILIANFYYLYEENTSTARENKKLRPRDFVALGLVLFSILIMVVATYDGPLSLLSVAATTLYEISIWQKSTKVYKFLGIPVAFSWMSYNAFIGSPAGVIMEAIMFITSIIGYTRELKLERKKKAALAKRRKTLAKKRRQRVTS